MTELKAVFETIAATNKWGDSESVSGAGSTLSYTYNLRRELALILDAFEIETLFDAPCGDFNWMREIPFPHGAKYIGGEIAASLVDANNRKYASAAREFIEFDITRDKFPKADVWFCRDCLFHLPFDLIFSALRGFCESEIGFVMMTNHLNTTGFVNRDIEAGEFRLLDFHIAPFHLPRDVFYRAPDYVFPFPQREMCIWSRDQIALALGDDAK